MLKLKVTTRLARLEKYKGVIRSRKGPIGVAFRQWKARILGFLQERYVRLSRGGGEWRPLSANTKRLRGDVRNAAILRDTNQLFQALTPDIQKPGKLDEDLPMGFRIGYGGPAKHRGSTGVPTIAGIAAKHQAGVGVPVRRIIVSPDLATQRLMAGDMDRALEQLDG